MIKVIKLSAVWCAPCMVFGEKFKKISEIDKYKNIEFKSLDIENDSYAELLVEKYGVRGVPTTLILNGKDELLCKVVGNVKEDDLINAINNSLEKDK